jgi:solute carrier family 25 aspartate/glutamate transporter 12/13
MATVTEAVKETLVGTTINVEPSQEVRATFDRHSIRDDVSGENYMTEKEFVNAIAPLHENYVSRRCDPFCGYDRRT